jgi:hypothetical protein
MMKMKKLRWGGLVAALMVGSFIAGTAIAKAPAAPKLPILTKLSEQTFKPLMDTPLPAMANIQGDGMKGAYMGYLKLPANFTSPPHSHSSDYWAVLVQGKMTHWATVGGSEKDAKQLGVGDLTFMPGKTEHISKCFPGAECILVVMQKGKFDFVMPKPAKTPAATPGPTAPPMVKG